MVIKTIHVPHLGGIDAAYQIAKEYDSKKPTIVLVHSFMATGDLYRGQFANKEMTDVANLIAIDLLGHGETRTKSEHFTYWDSATMNIQVMKALNIEKFFVLGTSQGGWVVARMALLAPEAVQGVIIVGSSMDYESKRSQDMGCWDVFPIGDALIAGWTSTSPTPDFAPDDGYCNTLIDLGLGKECAVGLRQFWVEKVKGSYAGDDGRRRARMACINLRDRDGLRGRVCDIRCPVIWLHGTSDVVYSSKNAEEEIHLFTSAVEKRLVVIPGGQHFLSASNPKETDPEILSFLQKHS